MGIRSDVAVALKKNVWDNLTAQSKSTLDDWFQEPASETQEGHILFYEERIKWYQGYDDLAQLYAELIGVFDDEDYLIVTITQSPTKATLVVGMRTLGRFIRTGPSRLSGTNRRHPCTDLNRVFRLLTERKHNVCRCLG